MFTARQKSISGMLSNSIFEIPRNQRRYVWKTDNWQDLWDDLSFIIESNISEHENKAHFIGSIVLKDENVIDGINHYTIIDGQQRAITIMLFLSAIMQTFKEREMNNDFLGNRKMLIVTDLKNRSTCALVSDYHSAIKQLITTICSEDNTDPFPKVLSKSIIDKVIDKQIGECVRFFYDKLSPLNNEEILRIRDALIDMQYIEIIANTDEDSYTIFEILNARGQALEDHELLKNYIMRYIRPQSQEKVDEVKEEWAKLDRELGGNIKRFFKHYASHKFRATPKESIYKVIFEATHRTRNINDLFDDILLKSKYYRSILKLDDDSLAIERKVFPFFIKKKVEQFRPVILSLMHQKEELQLAETDYESLINFLYVFFVCYNIIGEEKSNKLEDPIYKFAPILENEYSTDVVVRFKESLIRRLPNEGAFINLFKNIGWSNHTEFYRDEKKKAQVKIVLELLELHIGGRELDSAYTIEHIFPDASSEKHALIGNLLPLERHLNDICKDKPLADKIPIYKRSNYAITRRFAERCETTSLNFEIESRGEYMGKLLYREILGIASILSSNPL